MPTCPNCGSIVMNGDPYCSHCGTTFRWDDEEDKESIDSTISDEDFIIRLEAMDERHEGLSRAEVFRIKKDIQHLENVIKSLKYKNYYDAYKNCKLMADIYYNPVDIIESKLRHNIDVDVDNNTTFAKDYAEHLLIDAKRALNGEIPEDNSIVTSKKTKSSDFTNEDEHIEITPTNLRYQNQKQHEQLEKQRRREQLLEENLRRHEEWLEKERLKRPKFLEKKTKICPKCNVTLGKKVKKCPKCGYNFK